MSSASTLRLGPRVKEARLRKGLSLRQAAGLSKVPHGTIERVEQEKVLRPRPDILAALGRALDIPLSDLYALANYPTASTLPSFAPYLQARYQGLSPQAIAELEIYFTTLAQREGITLDGPADGEDET